MSDKFLEIVWAKSVTPGGRKLVLMALAHLADQSGSCEPTIEQLERITCSSSRAIKRHLIELERAGFISRERLRGDGGEFRASRYKLTRKASEA